MKVLTAGGGKLRMGALGIMLILFRESKSPTVFLKNIKYNPSPGVDVHTA